MDKRGFQSCHGRLHTSLDDVEAKKQNMEHLPCQPHAKENPSEKKRLPTDLPKDTELQIKSEFNPKEIRVVQEHLNILWWLCIPKRTKSHLACSNTSDMMATPAHMTDRQTDRQTFFFAELLSCIEVNKESTTWKESTYHEP